MKTIPLYAPVYGVDHPCGRTTSILINRQTQRVTHLVVKEVPASRVERLVPIEAVKKTSPAAVHLRCSRDEFSRMEPFVEIDSRTEMIPDYENAAGVAWMTPYVPLRQVRIETRSKKIPCGDVALQHGVRVQASDGSMGIVTGLRVEPASKRVKRLVVEPSLPLAHEQIVVPITLIERAEENIIFLRLDKHSLKPRLATRPT